MKILDYESGHNLRDVALVLTTEEARELASYLNRLAQTPAIGHAHLSEFNGPLLERELTVTLELDRKPLAG